MEHDLNGLMDKNINFTISHIKCLMRQILEGIAYLHWENIMHWDIKGANLLLNNKGILKITDFGLARSTNLSHNLNYTNRVVTLWYWAPELLMGSNTYDLSIDMWSVGCFFVELLTWKPLFPGKNENMQLDLILQTMGKPNEENYPGLSQLKNYRLLEDIRDYDCRLRPFIQAKMKS